MASARSSSPASRPRGSAACPATGPTVDGDTLRFAGSGTIRTVANSTADLPVSIEIRYAVDGEEVAPRDVLGHDGEVAVTYLVRNLTAVPTELTLVDGDGATSTETVDVAVPMVGSLSMTLPGAFRDVVAPGAVVVGDGRGGTVVNWSLLLFSPLGSETQEVTWTAQATDAVVPGASLQVLPVTPDSFGSLGSTETAYAGAVDSTTELTGGAREIDTNLRRLAEGAGTLLAGLTQLQDGADELATGLVGAADGAGDLSDGIGQARVGANELTTGLGDLATGANTLAAGIGSARTGADELDGGLGDLSAGARQLSDGLGTAQAGGNELATGLGQLSAGASDLATGADDLATGATTLNSKTAELVTGAGQLSAGAAQVLSGIEQLADGLTGSDGLPAAISGINQLRAGIGAVGTSGTLLDGLSLVSAGLVDALNGIGDPGTPDTLRNGVARVQGGLSNPACNPGNPTDPANPCGLTEVNGLIGGSATALLAELTTVLTTLGTIDATLLTADDQALYGSAVTTLQTSSALRAGTIEALSTGLAGGITQLQGGMALIDAGLVELADGIGDPATSDTLRNGVFRITAGVSNPACNPANPTDPSNPCGLLEGLTALRSGLSAAAGDVADSLGSATRRAPCSGGPPSPRAAAASWPPVPRSSGPKGPRRWPPERARSRDGAAQVAAGAASALAGGEDLTDGHRTPCRRRAGARRRHGPCRGGGLGAGRRSRPAGRWCPELASVPDAQRPAAWSWATASCSSTRAARSSPTGSAPPSTGASSSPTG